MKNKLDDEHKERHNESNRKWYYKDIEKTREMKKQAQRIYREKNREKCREKERKHYHENIDEMREKGKKKGKLQYSRHKNIVLVRNKKWNDEHKEQMKAYYSKYYQDHKDVILQQGKAYRDRVRQKVFDYFGNKCACCGETEPKFLTIDHINGGGNVQRKKLGKSGFVMYKWLIKNNFPDGFQLLCYNCNCAKGFFGECPHQLMKGVF